MLVSLLGTFGTSVFLAVLFVAMIAKMIIALESIKNREVEMYDFYLILDMIAYMIVLVSFALGKI